MRSLSVTFDAHLSGAALQLAECVLVTRLDSVRFGFTSLNQDVVVDAITYEANTWGELSPLSTTRGSGVDHVETSGLLTSDRVTETDLLAGVYDGAVVELFQVVWSNLSAGKFTLLKGVLGEVSQAGPEFTAELRSLSQKMAQQVIDLVIPGCRVRRLGDAQCFVGGVNYDNTHTMADFRFVAPVTVVTSTKVLRFGGPTTPVGGNTQASGSYDYGIVHFQTGANAGYEKEVKTHILSGSEAVITLMERFPYPVQVGDTAQLELGCPRLLAVCRDRFANAGNYRGEPHVPGDESVLKRGRR